MRLRIVAACWAAAALIAYALDLWGQTRHGLAGETGRAFGDDFINYWSGAWLAWHGRAGIIYDLAAFHEFQQALVGGPLQGYHYGYPPVLLVLTAPLAALPYVPALAIWLSMGWLAFWWTLRLAWPGGAVWLAIGTPALLINAIAGQNGLWTAALLGGGLCLIDRRPWIAGVLFGMQIYKPHLAAVVMLAMLAGRRWSVVAAAALTALALIGASVGMFGLDIWGACARTIDLMRRLVLEDGSGVWHRMVSVFVFARRLGADVSSAYLIQAATGFVAAAVVGIVWWRDVASADVKRSLAILGTCLVTPYLQDYDLVMGAFVVAWLVGEGRVDRWRIWVSALVLLTPLLAAPLAQWTGLAVGSLLLVPAFVLVAAKCFAGDAGAEHSEAKRARA
ncbi:glycosyltransferase family 87 protein [Xanthobacteraceae bacterium Astr-EGSB]|uniref:glycosyltransferase family 87 protein n=1 Tax=Astrobacterium formosum TaxID=3069710 RepID=UPI0027B1F873|nr:glycosyltransferase family 87 protein [Xanthobacteraceae bacterium Astr-EGSB]